MHERKFKNALFICIGVSSLGPQLLNDSIKFYKKIKCYFMGNSDPNGIDSILEKSWANFGKLLSLLHQNPEVYQSRAMLWKKLSMPFTRKKAITQEENVLLKYTNTNGWIWCLSINIRLFAVQIYFPQLDCYQLPYKG